jgi:hypothetical protein
LLCPIVALAQTQLKPIPDLKPASEYTKDKIEEIGRLAYHHWQFLAEEAPRVSGSFKTIRPIQGFSEKGDLIWEVRIIHLTQVPTGILWINDRTKDVLVLGKQK